MLLALRSVYQPDFVQPQIWGLLTLWTPLDTSAPFTPPPPTIGTGGHGVWSSDIQRQIFIDDEILVLWAAGVLSDAEVLALL